MSNSMRDILDKLAAGAGTQGWGAIAAISRSDLNQQLQRQYVERYQRLAFMPLFTGEARGKDLSVDTLGLEGVELGVPTLLFQAQSSSAASVVVAMNIVAGRYSGVHQSLSSATTVSGTFKITEPMGFRLTMTVQLATDDTGQVTLNLAEGSAFTCNLAGLDEAGNVRLAQFFADMFKQIPLHRSVFSLVQVDLEQYQAQPPASFRVYPMVAPGAVDAGAENFGDGALLLFMRLHGSLGEGQFPPAESLPYPIPDEHGTHDPDYGSTLILSREGMADVDPERLPVLDSLHFTGGDTFAVLERDRHEDLLVFSILRAAQASVVPAFTTIKAGQTQRFSVHNEQGQIIAATKWTAVSLQSHTDAGHGSISNDGVYSAPDPETIGHDSLRVVITATYNESGVTRTASGLLGVVFESMELAPRVTVVAGGDFLQPVSLNVSTLDARPVRWGLRGTEYGQFSENGHAGLFVADARSGKKALVAQQIEVHGSEIGVATVLIANGQQMLRIEPAFVPRARKSQAVQLNGDNTLLPGLRRRWKVIGGEGTVDQQGRFMPPERSVVASSVVSCEVVNNSVVLASGYSVIELSQVYDEPSWKELSMFTVTLPGGADNQRAGNLYPNGYQQVRLQIKTQAIAVDGIDYTLSVTERASMLLVDNDTRQNLKSVSPSIEGIAEEDDQAWRVSLQRNRFELAGAALDPAESGLNAPDIVTQNFYLHSRENAGLVGTFYATFQKDSGKWWTSLELEDINSRVFITPLRLPRFDTAHYTFVPTRTLGGGGDPTAEPPIENAADDPFDFHLKTIDYWTLSARHPDTGQAVSFETLKFLPVGAKETPNKSIILWESEQPEEFMFSFTGYIFDDSAEAADAQKIGFDEVELDAIMKDAESLDIHVRTDVFEKGKLVVTLHRTWPIDYVAAGDGTTARDYLSGSLAVRLIDNQGNAHNRKVSFLPDGVGRRNRLMHSLYSPPDEAVASK
ncbi:hypothetical protein CFN58_01860 [Pseudomonas avellanae]|uniref:Imidazoleglycerol-phosphate synthase n=2 Tax=Pseudomonas syringae group TaxID=136849 RepID=A0A261WNJ7_9PSED|nr:hypothetical protein [Pseudomonas syringae]ATV17548.1 hypothetical protein CT122_12225 [Pseudomonas syringae pv. actinidiae]OZI87748.1 hypothetical protein CFN58_01860 [Pseudomonas avellanae]GAO94549.1 Imidazoleglycerol-phosphate synthase [Pseudomonas syringae pv. actinidiae]